MKIKRLLPLVCALLLACAAPVPSAAAGKTALLTMSRIRNIVEDSGLSYEESTTDKEYILIPLYDEEDAQIYLGLFVEGANSDYLAIYMATLSSLAIDKDDMDKALTACNDWNAKYRWPKAYLDEEALTFAGEGTLACTSDVPNNMIYTFIDLHIEQCREFVSYLYDKGFAQFKPYTK